MSEPIWQFLLDKGIDLTITIISLFIGFKLGVSYETRTKAKEEKEKRQALLSELSKSLDDNLKLLNQITDEHVPRQEAPTFHLDTAWLHYFTSSASLLIPEVSGYREKYNRLRFELDHINNKINLAHLFGFWFVQLSIVPHVEKAKGWILEEQEALTKLNV